MNAGPEMMPVISSLASHIGYNPVERVLSVKHHDGSIYDYAGVHPLTHAALMNSPSKGAFLHKVIRGKHKHTQIK